MECTSAHVENPKISLPRTFCNKTDGGTAPAALAANSIAKSTDSSPSHDITMGCRNAASARALSLPTPQNLHRLHRHHVLPGPALIRDACIYLCHVAHSWNHFSEHKIHPMVPSTPLTSESRSNYRAVVGDHNRLPSGRIAVLAAVLDAVLAAVLDLLHQVSRHRCSKGQRGRTNGPEKLRVLKGQGSLLER